MVSTVDTNAVGLGADILYQSYFVCLKETSKSTVIEYGKSQGTTEFGDVFLTMIDTDHPLFVRLYSFGNGEKPLEIVDAHIISRHLTKANCKGDTVHDNQTNMCVQHCHELCDPSQGCKATSSDSPLATNCNACRYVKNAHTGECLKECPDDMLKIDENICRRKQGCDGVQCLNGGTCRNLKDGKFECACLKSYVGQYCEIKQGCDEVKCLNGGTCRNLDDGKFKCECLGSYVGQYCKDRGLITSAIVGNSQSYLAKLADWLKPVAQSGHYWKRCWQASQDGWEATRFHSLCDGKGPTVTIIRVGKYIFGGYTSISWGSSSGYQHDSKAFLFSLENKPGWAPVKLPQTGKDSSSRAHSIYISSSYGPTFGNGHDILVSNQASSNRNSYTNLGYTYSPPSGHSYGSTFAQTFLAGGSGYNFTPDEVETFYETT